MAKLVIDLSGVHACELAEYALKQMAENNAAIHETKDEHRRQFLQREIETWGAEYKALTNHFYGRSVPEGGNQ